MDSKKLFLSFIFIFFQALLLNAQIPTEVPHPDNNTPVDFSDPADIIIYIVLPVIVIVLYFVWRKSARKKDNKED